MRRIRLILIAFCIHAVLAAAVWPQGRMGQEGKGKAGLASLAAYGQRGQPMVLQVRSAGTHIGSRRALVADFRQPTPTKLAQTVGREVTPVLGAPAEGDRLDAEPAVRKSCLAKGVHKKAAIGILMHKIIRIIYAMLKNKTPFNPEIDRMNQLRSQPKNTKRKLPRVRRLQMYDDSAPISRRRYKKRKEQVSSQDESLVISGIENPDPSDTGSDIIISQMQSS